MSLSVLENSLSFSLFKKLIDFIVQSSFKLTGKLRISIKISIYPPPHVHGLTTIHPRGKFVIIDEPTGTCHCYPASIVYIEVHSCCYRFYEFGQMYGDTNPPLWYHAEWSHRLKTPLCFTCSSPPHNPLQPLVLSLSPWFCLFQMSWSWNHAPCGLFCWLFHLMSI